MTGILLIILLSILKVDNWLDQKITSYNVLSLKSFFFNLTRLNWQYGFFTSQSNQYQYIKSDIIAVNEVTEESIFLSKDGSIETFGHPVNSLRLNTAIQQITRDSIYLEAGSRSIALYMFNKMPQVRRIDFIVLLNNILIKEENNRYYATTRVDTFYNRTLSY